MFNSNNPTPEQIETSNGSVGFVITAVGNSPGILKTSIGL
jgi:hypothetical protein